MTATIEDVVRSEVDRRRPKGILAAPQRIIAVCTPTLGQVSMWWTTSLVDLIWPMNTAKAILPMVDQTGGEIAEMRNRIVCALRGAQTDTTRVHALFWLDDDVICNRAAMLALAQHGRPIASGVYFSKGDFPTPLIFDGPCAGTHPFEPNEVFEAWGWAQGLSLVEMSVYDQMEKELDLGTDKYGAPLWYEPSDFRVRADGSISMNGTEDFPFFEKAATLGYKPLVDCTAHAFGWHYDTIQKTGYPKQQWEQFVRREPIIWPAKNGREEVIWK